MLIIWRGYGCLIPIIFFVTMVTVLLSLDEIMGHEIANKK